MHFDEQLLEYFLDQGDRIFGGAVRDHLSGDLYSPEWIGDFDILRGNPNMEENSLFYPRLISTAKSTKGDGDCCYLATRYILISKTGSYRYRHVDIVDPDLIPIRIDLDVNNLVMTRDSITHLWEMCTPVHEIVKKCRDRQYSIVDEDIIQNSFLRKSKMMRLNELGWKQV